MPLAKLSPDDPTTVEVFECCINGPEIAPGYTEQNDPIAQRNTLDPQAGGEQQKPDFFVALEHGLPPAGGLGLGIDRLCLMLPGKHPRRHPLPAVEAEVTCCRFATGRWGVRRQEDLRICGRALW